MLKIRVQAFKNTEEILLSLFIALVVMKPTFFIQMQAQCLTMHGNKLIGILCGGEQDGTILFTNIKPAG